MSLTRRGLLKGGLAAGAVALAAGSGSAEVARPVQGGRGAHPAGAAPAAGAAAFSFVHLTDMHVTPKRRGDLGYRRCIESVCALRPRPAFALMGGDLAFDGLYTEKAQFDEQIRLYREVSDELRMPYYNCMGNHDALGWSARRKCGVDDPDIGKKMIMDRLAWERPYYSFDHAGWHFVVLDSIFPTKTKDGPGYEPRIGPEQLAWLAHDLGAAGDRPKIALTHIAAFCNVGQVEGDANAKAMNGSMVLWDTKALRQVLERHRVKALLQGHSHKPEEFRWNGVWYLTSAAVSGAWWSGDWIGHGPGYTLFHCDGEALSWEHRTFGWEPHLEPEDELERRKLTERRAFEAEQARLRAAERGGPAPARTPDNGR